MCPVAMSSWLDMSISSYQQTLKILLIILRDQCNINWSNYSKYCIINSLLRNLHSILQFMSEISLGSEQYWIYMYWYCYYYTYWQNAWNDIRCLDKCRKARSIKHCMCRWTTMHKRFSLLIGTNDVVHYVVSCHFRLFYKQVVNTSISTK